MIRRAAISDLPQLMEMGAAFHAESGWAQFAAFDPDSWQASLDGFFANPDWLTLVWDDGEVRGFIMGAKTPLYFNRAVSVSHELLWWVYPEHRKGIGRKLFAAFHAGANLGFQTVSETTPRCEAVKRSLRMDGWKPVETVLAKRLG